MNTLWDHSNFYFSYALSNNQTISYSSCLFQLLIQSSIKVAPPSLSLSIPPFSFQIPNRRRRKEEDEDDDDVVRDFSKEDGVLRDSIGEAKILCNKFIVGFLTKSETFFPYLSSYYNIVE